MSAIEEMEKDDAKHDQIWDTSMYLVVAVFECVLGALTISGETLTIGNKIGAAMFFVAAGIFFMCALYAFEKKRNWHR